MKMKPLHTQRLELRMSLADEQTTKRIVMQNRQFSWLFNFLSDIFQL
jgi:hypothetical protein